MSERKEIIDIYHMKDGMFAHSRIGQKGLEYISHDEDGNRHYDVVPEWNFVASVLASDLEDAFEKTQHSPFNPSWHKAKGVMSNQERQRSSMIGDMFELHGRKYIIASEGFLEYVSQD